MKLSSAAFFLFVCTFCVSQTFAQHNLGAGGTSSTTASGSVSFSLGQVAYTTSANANGSAARGVQQTYPELDIRVPEHAELFAYSLYPNPNRGVVFLQLPEAGNTVYQLYMHDLGGRLIAVQKLPGGLSQLDLSTFASGAYTAQLYIEDAYQAHFIIMKTN
jgi:hypothetical protein